MTAPSAWGRIVDDTVARVKGITPTASREKRWHHAPDSRSSSTETVGGAAFRLFRTVDLETGDARVAGGGERQEQWTLVLVATYPRIAELQALVAADHVDLIEALAPTSTYAGVRVAGVVTLCVRDVGQPEGPIDAAEGVVEVRYPIRCIWRHPVTLV